MIRVMDGVRPTMQRSRPVVLPQLMPQPAKHFTEPQSSFVGMDGIRRSVMPTPRDTLVAMQTEPVRAIQQAETAIWQMPSLRLPHIAWKRPAIAFGLFSVALATSTATVALISSHSTTKAHADSSIARQTSKVSAPTASPAAAPAAAPALVPHKNGLQPLLDSFASANPDKFGIVVKDLTTGEVASINPDRQLSSASLYKLFVAQRIYQRIDLGQTDYGKAAGGDTGRNIADCLRVMINVSDNDCGRALGTILGWGSQDQALAVEGYGHTTLATPQQTSPSDVATLLSRLYFGTLLSSNSSDKFMTLLKDQQINNRLPIGLPAGTVIAHKTGDLDDVVHDAGIVFGPKTNYVVVVMSGKWSSPGNAPALFGDLSSQLWNYFEN